jgi:hypothetical protein
MSEDGNSFEDKLRAMARELSQSVERAMEQLDVNDLAGMVGVDPERAREWVDGAGTWLREHADDLQGFGSGPFGSGPFGGGPFAGGGSGATGPARDPSDPRDQAVPKPGPAQPPSAADAATFATASPHPLDLPTEEQGAALAALDSGRWSVEPGTEILTSRGQGPGPSDALGLVRELRVRDWIAQDGEITRAGRRALDRWLDACAPAH